MTAKKNSIVVGLSITFAMLWLFRIILGDSARRISSEHGLTLPTSASAFECRGDAWLRLVMDCGAASSFEASINDIPAFLAQLRVHNTTTGVFESIFPGNPEYQVHRAWMSGIPTATSRCSSPTGDALFVQTWPINSSRMGVCLYTDWN